MGFIYKISNQTQYTIVSLYLIIWQLLPYTNRLFDEFNPIDLHSSTVDYTSQSVDSMSFSNS